MKLNLFAIAVVALPMWAIFHALGINLLSLVR
jgi:hypothetical protein